MRDTLRLWASGVSVVTTASAGQRAGMTVSSFNSLSIDPPLILVCLQKSAHTVEMLENTGHFAVSILAADQAALSDRFAGRVPLDDKEEKFDGLPCHVEVTGSPILSGAVGWFDCRVASMHDGHTHWIVVGEVLATGNHPERQPLVYYNRGYHGVGPLDPLP